MSARFAAMKRHLPRSASCRALCEARPRAIFRSSSSARPCVRRCSSGRPASRGSSGRMASAPRHAPPPAPAPSIARAMPRSCRSRQSPLAAPRRAGCRSSSIRTAASPASSPNAPPPRRMTRSCSRSTISSPAIASATCATASPSRLASVPSLLPEWRSSFPGFFACDQELQRITFANYVERPGATDLKTLAQRMPSLLDPSLSWRDVDALRRWWSGRFF